MVDPDERERLARLEDRINQLKAKDAPKPHQESHYSQAQLAWRMVIEIVAGLLIGFGMGYGLDYLFGTIPIFLVIFTLLGLAAGIKTMMRSAAEIQHEKLADEAETDMPEADLQQGSEKRTTHGD
ncbi:AtpZ/AtpI family protein [Roseovarius aestuariivivens]|uniref:AtpZ/AtpI family protein n=1 Tax=Roseovarius aestuariivivens TaxID=1888910 RepID=UPI0010812B2C|nr:AtpZ/AtpI family protein [Roseovarius aestuariivivens]